MELPSHFSQICICNVSPELDSGRFPVKRILGDVVAVEADIFTQIGGPRFHATLKFRHSAEADWTVTPMESLGNDRWRACFPVSRLGQYEYEIHATLANGEEVRHPTRRIVIDPVLARFGAWYEVFPRSGSAEPGRHGTLCDLANRLPHLAEMGFDVLYLPPIHPIGRTARKGRNNSLIAQPGEPGCPWAIGAAEGGHKSIHPELGTLDDFQFLRQRAAERKIEIALDIALQCSPDHPYVQAHPEWFLRRPDGSIAFAEDPPNRFEDVVPLRFDTSAWRELWTEMRSIFEFWIEQGVRVFRVDNPHTKPFAFWEWLISDLKSRWPELIFLSEGLTRPNLMTQLAKLGFSQSYDYFPWRNTKRELTDYYSTLAAAPLSEYFRPNLWPNTPQNLPPVLQHGGRRAFMSRLILAATLGASYGIYGPVFERCENHAVAPGSVDYRDSEQYELKCWDWDPPGSLCSLIAQVNRIRRDNPALHSNDRLRFHGTDHEALVAYSKSSLNGDNVILIIVNLEPLHSHCGWIMLDPSHLGCQSGPRFMVHDLLTGERYTWQGGRNYVALPADRPPAHVFRFERE